MMNMTETLGSMEMGLAAANANAATGAHGPGGGASSGGAVAVNGFGPTFRDEARG